MSIKYIKRGFTSKLTFMSASLALGLSLMASSSGALASEQEKGKNNKNPKFEFGLVADSQYCDCDAAGTRFYRNSISKLTEAVDTFNQRNLAFTVQLGDTIDRNVESFDTILPIYKKIESPLYHTLGNHDFPVTTDRVVDIMDMPNQYYDFGHKDWRFIVLDTNDLSLYANAPGTAKYEQAEAMYNELGEKGADNAQTWNGGVGPEQITWLHGVLEKASQRNEKVVVFSHMPIYPKNMHNAWNDDVLVKELESAGNVVAYFNGHNHAGNYAEKNGIKYVNFQGMVETADSNAYSVIRVFKDHLEIDGFGREPDQVLKINTTKK